MIEEIDRPKEHRTRTAMIRAAAELMQRRGYFGAGVAEILTNAEAPRGSLYYHFPGGKNELAQAAVRFAGQIFKRDLDELGRKSTSLDDYLDALEKLSVRDLVATDYDAACPVAATALDVPQGERDIVEACAEVFEQWEASIAEGLFKLHGNRPVAHKQAGLVLTSLFGAMMVARSDRKTDSITQVIAVLRQCLPMMV